MKKQVYSEKTKEIYDLPCNIGGFGYTIPKPTKGVYEYRKPKITEQQTLSDNIIVIDNIALNEIIKFPKWIHKEQSIRIILDDSLLEIGGDYDAMYRNLEIKKALFEPYSYTQTGVYLSFLLASDGFSVDESGIISHTDVRLIIQQQNFNFIEQDGIIRENNK